AVFKGFTGYPSPLGKRVGNGEGSDIYRRGIGQDRLACHKQLIFSPYPGVKELVFYSF
ncbi:Methylmalonyl-CoA mutase, partial [termite gut metagenome]